MDSIGAFCTTQINGKAFLIFNFSSQTDNPSSSSSSSCETSSIDSGGDKDLSLFLCPSLRLKAEKLKQKENGYSSDDDVVLPVNTHPHFVNRRSGLDQQVQSLLDSDSHEDICKLPLALLFWCNDEGPYSNEFRCGACRSSQLGTYYYLCVTCGERFHRECVELPLKIKHPSYPFLSFQLYTKIDSHDDMSRCIFCERFIDQMAYHCPTYNVSMHPFCAMEPIPILVNHSKRHPHPLTFFPKQDLLPCNVCGLIKKLLPTYICAQCVFVVHQNCIHLPYVIKITRHQHRLSLTSSLPSGKYSCGVCHKNVDNNGGAYSCNMCDDYFVHTKCATWKNLWDGIELEGIPEEHDDVEIEPFERIDDEVILHFSHDHRLKLENRIVYKGDNFCQACTLPVYEGNYYSCMDECDFILHETCANASLKIFHALHPHPLTLEIVTNRYGNKGHFCCDECQRESCGFVYECSKWGCEYRLDVRCASVSEPFSYQGHEHPLFLCLNIGEDMQRCQICKQENDQRHLCAKLNCIVCDYLICLKCATLPYKARYEDDEHYLTYCKGKEAGDHSDWCDVCETKIAKSTKEGFYRCKDCCNTLHVDCLLGKDPYMKPGQTIVYHGTELHILRNDTTLFRPFCHSCEQHCPHRVVFKKNNEVFCSLSCVSKFRG